MKKTKTTMHHRQKAALLTGLVLVVLSSAGLLLTQKQADELVLTEPISSTQPIGGSIPKSSISGQDRQSPEPNQLPTTADVTRPSNSTQSKPELIQRAPKQLAIKSQVETEIAYRALLAPNDPYAQSSWVFNQMNAAAAWDIETGSSVTVAIIDSGFALAHEDLSESWLINPDEQGTTVLGDDCWTGSPESRQTNNCDDDGNGYVDDWRGWNFVLIDNSPQAGRENPNGAAVAHGTQVAGLAGATTNNATGTASLNWHTKLMPLQALSDEGTGYTSDIAAAIYYAVDNGADVINMSLGSSSYDPFVEAATDYAYARGVVVIAAAGNCGTGLEFGCDPSKPGAMSYPASSPHVISVGALRSDETRASFSSYGPALDVAAPGSGTMVSPMWLPTNPTNAYSASLHGTSFSAPIVSSLASLLRSIRPTTSAEDIIALINGSARKLLPMGSTFYTEPYGHGVVNAENSVQIANALLPLGPLPQLAQTGTSTSEHSFTSTSLLSSGCSTANDTYCTIWATSSNGKERYLPYKSTAAGAGWQWSGGGLDSGEWRLRARSGDSYSQTSYYLFSK